MDVAHLENEDDTFNELLTVKLLKLEKNTKVLGEIMCGTRP